MRFVNNVSKTLVGALLFTSAFGLPGFHVSVSIDEDGLITNAAPKDIGPDPNPKALQYFKKYCSSALKPKGKRSIETFDEEGFLQYELSDEDIFDEDIFEESPADAGCSKDAGALAKPPGYGTVEPGHVKAYRTNEPGLWSEGFGTCAGIVVQGTPGPKRYNKVLFHMLLHDDWNDFRKQWSNFAGGIDDVGMTNMRATLYTVDTRSSNPELRDAFVRDVATNVEKDYTDIVRHLGEVIRGPVTRRYHPFARPGEMSVSNSGVTTDPTS